VKLLKNKLLPLTLFEFNRIKIEQALSFYSLCIKGLQPWTSIMPTGGVSIYEANLKGWFDARVTCVGMGSKLISKEILANQSYAELTNNVKDTLTLIQRL
jgi:2-keto-3-deoxy-6-phosphogluconate aldolase